MTERGPSGARLWCMPVAPGRGASWAISGSICRNSSPLSNVQATEPLDLPYATSFAGGKYAVRKRADGGYTIAHNAVTVSDIIPASFKYLKAFLPALRSEWPHI